MVSYFTPEFPKIDSTKYLPGTSYPIEETTMRRLIPMFCLCLCAQDSEPKRPKETLALLDEARALPPEFCADLLLKLAASPRIPGAKWKRELIEEAFTAGAHAPLPYARKAYGQAVEARWTQEYWENDLEALTLQARAAEAILNLDPQRAAVLFNDIVLPTITKEKCDEPAVANVDRYYEVAAKIFAKSFTPKQREKEEDLRFLEQRIAGMQSPAQVTPVLRMIFAVKAGPDALKRFLGAYAVALDRVNGGDRAYGTYEGMSVPAYSPEVAGAPMLLTAMRGYIARQVSGARCSDHIVAGKLPLSVDRFNALAARVDPAGGWLRPITADEAKPLKDDGTYGPQRPFASKRAWDALMALKWLDHGDTNPVRPWTAEERKSQEWNDHFNDTLKLIEGWKAEEENSPEEYLINVAQVYAALAAKAPAGAAKENVMGRFMNFLETHYAETANRNLWFTEFMHALMGRVRSSEEDRAWALEHCVRSRNPIIALYAKLEAR